jgi:hypothetical protein
VITSCQHRDVSEFMCEFSNFIKGNGLRVLLVRDRSTKKPAAALAVGVGAAGDPVELPGLAHFTEHMSMQGSDLFPGDNTYKVCVLIGCDMLRSHPILVMSRLSSAVLVVLQMPPHQWSTLGTGSQSQMSLTTDKLHNRCDLCVASPSL